MNVLDEVKEISSYVDKRNNDKICNEGKVSVLDALTHITECSDEKEYSPMAVKIVLNDIVMQWYKRYCCNSVTGSNYIASKSQVVYAIQLARDWFNDKYGEELSFPKKMKKPQRQNGGKPSEHVKTTKIKVYPSDIHKIGSLGKCGCKIDDTDTEYTAFYCKVELANIEEILLRDILSLYGCEIVETNDVPRSSEPFDCDIEFKTNLPYDRYMNL